MFGISFAELVIISLLVLVVMGPEKLPEVARWAGKGLRELRQASNTLRNALEVEQHQSPRTVGTDQSAGAVEDPSTDSAISGPSRDAGTEIGAQPGESPPPSNIDQVDDQRFDEMVARRARARRTECRDVELPAGVETDETTTAELPAPSDPDNRALYDVALPAPTAPEASR